MTLYETTRQTTIDGHVNGLDICTEFGICLQGDNRTEHDHYLSTMRVCKTRTDATRLPDQHCPLKQREDAEETG
jgi:hypothetical protein